MAPLVESFPPSLLPTKIQRTADGRPRKPAVKLEDCARKEMLQYFCELNGPRDDPASKVVCEPCVRMFRRCADGLTVETTSWEGGGAGSGREG